MTMEVGGMVTMILLTMVHQEDHLDVDLVVVPGEMTMKVVVAAAVVQGLHPSIAAGRAELHLHLPSLNKYQCSNFNSPDLHLGPLEAVEVSEPCRACAQQRQHLLQQLHNRYHSPIIQATQ